MTKPLLQLTQVESLVGLPEAGMGFYLVDGELEGDKSPRLLVIAGDGYAIPVEHPKYFSIADLLDGEPVPDPASKQPINVSGLTTASLRTASLPSGYGPSAGAVPLLGTVSLTKNTLFYRFIGSAKDPRFAGSILAGWTLARDTYLTTASDQNYANTGFAAVGRYALPIPVPASHVFEYELQKGTQLAVGTVLPNFGQAGGGVEVKTLGTATVVTHNYVLRDDF
jgi:hypothetical protein